MGFGHQKMGPVASALTTSGSVAVARTDLALNPMMRRPSIPDARTTSWSRGGRLLVPLAALAALVAACGTGAVPPSRGGDQTGSQSATLPFVDTGSQLGAQPGAQVITFTVVGAAQGTVGPDGRRHDTFTATSPTTVTAGRAVTVEIENRDDMAHSFTIPELGIDRVVPAAEHGSAGEVTFSFTPTTAGTYRWFCVLPCDQDNNGWAMGPYATGTRGMGGMGTGMMEPGVDGFMAGYITVS